MDKNAAFTLDSLAMRLAAAGGQAWTDLCEFPGYRRNVWREEARTQILRDIPGAIFEMLPVQWDGRDGGCIVRTFRSEA